MAKRTVKRMPFSVPSPKIKDGYFNQVEFKGICDDRNDVTIDQQSYSDALNLYVDDGNVLTSRPPLKFSDNEVYIVEQWMFGNIGLRLHRIKEGENFIFLLRCFTHEPLTDEGYPYMNWTIPIDEIGYDFVPVIKHVQIEDKIFTWFGGVTFSCFFTTLFYFDNALKYLYFPVHKLVINGIESELETKNFLTETYRRRHQYSAVSSVNFERLTGRKMSVNLNGVDTQNKSNHLYDITIDKNQDKMLVYPYSPMGSNFFVDVVQTPRATVVLRYSPATKTIEVSFDGKSFRPLPSIEDIVGNPQLTKDGMWVVVFTSRGVGQCRIVAQETADFIDPERVLAWVVKPYMEHVLVDGIPRAVTSIDTSFTPSGHFETIDQFAYVVQCAAFSEVSSNYNIPYVYAEWLSGANDRIWGHNALISKNTTQSSFTPMVEDNIRVHFRYAPPTQRHQNLASVVSILTDYVHYYDGNTLTYDDSVVLYVWFEQSEENLDRTIKNDDRVFVTEMLGQSSISGYEGYIHRLTDDGMDISNAAINAGDIVSFTPFPINLSVTDDWSSTKEYFPGDVVTKGRYDYSIWRCIRQHTNSMPPATGDGNTYWEAMYIQTGSGNITLPWSYVWEYQINTGTPYTPVLTTVYSHLDWKYGFLAHYSGMRYRIEKIDGTTGSIKITDRIRLVSIDFDVTYEASNMTTYFGTFPPGRQSEYDSGSAIMSTSMTWETYISMAWAATRIRISRASPQVTHSGNILALDIGDTASLSKRSFVPLAVSANTSFHLPCNQMDVITAAPEIDGTNILYKSVVAYGLRQSITNTYYDYLNNITIRYTTDQQMTSPKNITQADGPSFWFRIQNGTSNIITDKYLYVDDRILSLPRNGELYPLIDDNERQVANDDNLVLALSDGSSGLMSYDSNIHKLTTDGINLSSAAIQSGDVVSYATDAMTAGDYLSPRRFVYDSSAGQYYGIGNRYKIQKLGISGDNWVQVSGSIRTGDLVRLISYEHTDEVAAILPVGNPGNPFNYPLYIYSERYPAVPGGWQPGDPWPSDWLTHPPLVIDQGEVRLWSAEHADPLPTGPIQLFGVVNLFKRIKPLSIDSTGVWYDIDGTLWTSETSTTSFLELDEYINAEVSNIGGSNTRWFPSVINFRRDVPKHSAVLNEYYMSFVTAKEGLNLLQITATRRDEYKLFTKEGRDFLIYLPKINEQQFAKEITNLHTLSENEMGIFTQDEIWYMQWTGSAYTKPVKSKIPVGCRDGSDIITALDGKLIVFTTPRGVTALSPQDFVASTEQTLSYLSDNIQSLYQAFYNNPVHSTVLLPSEFQYGYRPEIKIVTYKYWIIFHRYMDRIVLAFDTRNSTWWKWETPYPIKSMIVDSRLHFLMHIDYNPIEDMAIHYPPKKLSLLGMDFIWSDREVDNITYYDDVIPQTLNGYSEWIEDRHTGGRRRVFYAEPMIKWSMLSQRLHFGKINNYKHIKALNMIAKGDSTMTAKLTTKVYRDFYHPEKSEVMEISINNLTTFVRRMNIMHFLNFQYKLETDIDNEQQSQLKLDSLGLKYEVKEEI